jgi:hypothetical protein
MKIARIIPALFAASAFAHDGHGAPPLHWHATDGFGFALILALAAFAFWIARDR